MTSDDLKMEIELESHLQDQKSALSELELVLKTDYNAELVDMKAELELAIQELEGELMELKKARLLTSLGTYQSQEINSSCVIDHGKSHSLAPGGLCRFRYTDGCWYDGRLSEITESGTLVYFTKPTRPFMRAPVQILSNLVKGPLKTVKTTISSPGSRVLALCSSNGLWEAAEVVSSDAKGQVTVTFTQNGYKAVLSAEEVATSRYAVCSDDEDEVEPLPSGSVAEAVTLNKNVQGSDSSFDESEEEVAATSEEDDEYCVVWSNMTGGDDVSDNAGAPSSRYFHHARQAAEAGPQTETAHFASWEAHSRGIASKLLARMGYKAGSGLGRRGASGITEALEVIVLPPRRGLGGAKERGGATAGKRKRKRGGERARRRKEAAAAAERRAHANETAAQDMAGSNGPGLFNFINTSLGDQSEAAARIRKASSQKENTSSVFYTPSVPSKDSTASRTDLIAQQQEVARVQSKVSQLQAMLQRNKADKTLSKQIAMKLKEAQTELSLAKDQQAKVNKAVSDKEAHKKWVKF